MTRWRLIKSLLAVATVAIVGLGVAVGVAASRDSGSGRHDTIRLQEEGDGSDATAWLGIHGTDSEDPPGVKVVEVIDGTGADDAGLARDDVITAIDGDDVTAIEQLRDAIATHSVGDEVTLSVVKGGEGELSEVVATLGESPPYYNILGKIGEFEFEGLRDRLGGHLDEIFPDGFDAFLDGSFRYKDSNGDTHEVTAVSGTVTDVSDDSLTIESANGDSRSFGLTDGTDVPNDLASGDDVLVVTVDGETKAVIAPDHIFDNIPIPNFDFDVPPHQFECPDARPGDPGSDNIKCYELDPPDCHAEGNVDCHPFHSLCDGTWLGWLPYGACGKPTPTPAPGA